MSDAPKQGKQPQDVPKEVWAYAWAWPDGSHGGWTPTKEREASVRCIRAEGPEWDALMERARDALARSAPLLVYQDERTFRALLTYLGETK